MDTTKLKGLHPDLIKVITKFAEIAPDHPFVILEGLRSLDREKQMVKEGHSQTLKSRHLTGHAIDLGVTDGKGKVLWKPWSLYANQAVIVKKAASLVNVPIEWGGDWKTLKDGPHFQLPWSKYP